VLARLLDPAQEELLREERRLLARLRTSLARFETDDASSSALDRSIEQLDELFLLVVVGEFNSGKSAFINALLGSRVVEEGVTPTTAQINVLQYGERVERRVREPSLHVITAPAPLLREIHIVDTPGTNAVIREHERITAEFVPRSDLVLFVTSADRPFTETERAFLEQVRGWGKKVVIAVNKIDIFDNESSVGEVVDFVGTSARTLLGFRPDVFPVSAKLALRAKQGDPSVWAPSRFEALERHIEVTLDAPGRVRLKLLNPIGVAEALVDRHAAAVGERLALLQEDFATLDEVERQLGVFQADLTRDVEFRMADIDRILLEMERRGHEYFEDTLRVGRVFDLLNRSRVQQGFEQQVIADAPQQVERKVGELVDWLVDADRRQWEDVTTHLAERRRRHRDRLVGDEAARRFHHDRGRLIDVMAREAQKVVDSYDRRREAQVLADGARNAVATSAAVGAGALGLGAIVAAVATTAAADVTGLVMASLLATIGFFILPAKRQRAKEEMRRKIADLRSRLSTSLREQFSREIARGGERVREGIAPYSRFVRAEGEKLRAMDDELREIRAALADLRARIERQEAPPGARAARAD
jgi:small GTP-binding protein